jgi:hypothetical protein
MLKISIMKSIKYVRLSVKGSLVLLAASIFTFTSCKKEEVIVTPSVASNEYMTTVKLRFENKSNPNDTLWAVWKDLTPNDQNAPDTSGAIINLDTNKIYKVSVKILDETKNPVVDITEDIRERGNFHFFTFFTTGTISSNLTIEATDFDTNPTPFHIGLENEFKTNGTVSTGRLEGVLKHQPNTKNGTFAPGNSDIDVFFTLNIN